MEMERTRRSVDRNREIAVKKPRLSDEAERDRGASSGVPARAPPRAASAGGSGQPALDPRLRLGERQRENSGRGGGPYQPPPPPPQQQQMQELVAEYKTALAELTFNSKPIITNLTIIAGENIHAAKGIAATICSHILEVPSDQKLPTLYLLDSIVKNIGRDYIKYFAARLPEVFCKAYRQVDSSIHPGMRHLYGTWKGVFPPTSLHLIEKELFTPAVNNSSSRGTDSQSSSQPRPSHSIHVNPKYLEARQRLHQSSYLKVTNTDGVDSSTNSAEDQNRSDRTSRSGNSRPRDDSTIVAQNVQYPLISEPSRKSSSLGDRDPEYAVGITQFSEPKIVRTNKRAMEQSGLDNSQYGIADSGFDSCIEPMNGFEFQRGKYRETMSSQILGQKLPNNQTDGNQVSSRNWKNSEEEEYMWDDMSSKLPDNADTVPWKGERNSEDSEKHTNVVSSNLIDSYWNKFNAPMEKSTREERFPRSVEFGEKVSHTLSQTQSYPMAQRNRYSDSLYSEDSLVKSGNPSSWLSQETPAKPLKHTSGTAGIFSQLDAPHAPFNSALSVNLTPSLSNVGPVHAASSGPVASSSNSLPQSASVPLLKSHIPSLNHIQTQSDFQSNQIHMQNSGHSDRSSSLSSQLPPDRFPVMLSGRKLASQQNTEPAVSQASVIVETSTYAPFPDVNYHVPLPRQSHHEQSAPQQEAQFQLPKEAGKPFSIGTPPNSSADTPVQSSTADLLAAIMTSRLVSGLPVERNQTPTLQAPLPGGGTPLQLLMPLITEAQPSSELDPGACSKTLSSEVNRPRAVNPPLPPGPPPPASMLPQLASSTDGNLNPLSNLLRSLVAKGILSSHGHQTQTTDMVQSNCDSGLSIQLPCETTKCSVSSSEVAVPVKDAIPHPSGAELSRTGDYALSSETEEDLKDLIGFEFKPEIIRCLHAVVINALYDDLKHQCRRCGLRFRFSEQLDRHMYSHDSRNLELTNQASRKWFSNLNDFVSMSPILSHPLEDVDVVEATDFDDAQSEPMVPADESQCICVFCAEPFEDVYCHLKGMWMYRGAVYIARASKKQKMGSLDRDVLSGLIVHTHCMHESSKDGL